MTASETVSRWARGFVAAGALWLVCWQAAVLAGLPRRTVVTLALQGFVLHTLFGKAYSLVPSYFDRELALARAPTVHLPLALTGTAGLAAAPLVGVPRVVGTAGAALWAVGVAVFLGTLGLTIRDNPTGAATGTGEHNADRQSLDRIANAVVPLALLYLAVGAYATLAGWSPLPPLLDGYAPRASHLLAAGTVALVLFGVGFRLLPRFLVVESPTAAGAVVLPAGAVGPLLLAVGLPSGPLLTAGAALEGIAVVGFALTVLVLVHRSDRDRVGFHGVAWGAVAGLLGVALALHLAFVGPTAGVVTAHYRTMLLGFLGTTIVGVAFQFYPPTVGRFPGASDRTALAAIACLATGLVLGVAGLLAGLPVVTRIGDATSFVGSVVYAALLLGLFVQRLRD